MNATEKALTVEQVHKEFKDFPTTIGKFLQDLEINLKSDKEVYRKSKEVQSMGFFNANKDIKDPDLVFNYTKIEHEKISELYFKYPHIKFISKRGVDYLCKKYNLFHGSSKFFKGDIPEKNMDDVLRLKDLDLGYDPILNIYLNGQKFVFALDISTDPGRCYTPDTMPVQFLHSIEVKDQYGRVYVTEYLQINNSLSPQPIMFHNPPHVMINGLGTSNMHSKYIERRIKEESERRKEAISDYKTMLLSKVHEALFKSKDLAKTSKYSIVANHEDFTELVGPEDQKITMDIPPLILPDPIILQKTVHKDIYGIITAWDKEAMDPLVVNQNLN